MRRKKRSVPLFFLSIISMGTLAYFLTYIQPHTNVLLSPTFSLPSNILFVCILFLAVFFFTSYLLASLRRGLFIGLFIVGALLFRLFHLTHTIFPVLLGILFITLELAFRKKNI